jgi:hypothetical protein
MYSLPHPLPPFLFLSCPSIQESSQAASLAGSKPKTQNSPRPVLPRQVAQDQQGTAPRDTDDMEVALKTVASPAATNLSRLRSESFESDEGEEHDMTTVLDKPAAAPSSSSVAENTTATRGGGVGGFNLLIPSSNNAAAPLAIGHPQPSSPTAEPVDMAALLAPLLGSQVRLFRRSRAP